MISKGLIESHWCLFRCAAPLLSSRGVIRPYSPPLLSPLLLSSLLRPYYVEQQMPLYPFSSSFHPHPHPFVLLHICNQHICTDSYSPPVSSFASPSFCCAFHFYLFYISLPVSVIFFLHFSLISFVFYLPIPPSCFLSPLSLFPAFICSVSAPQTGCYVTVRWCVGLLKGLKGPPSCRAPLLPALTAALRVWSDTHRNKQYVNIKCHFAPY